MVCRKRHDKRGHSPVAVLIFFVQQSGRRLDELWLGRFARPLECLADVGIGGQAWFIDTPPFATAEGLLCFLEYENTLFDHGDTVVTEVLWFNQYSILQRNRKPYIREMKSK